MNPSLRIESNLLFNDPVKSCKTCNFHDGSNYDISQFRPANLSEIPDDLERGYTTLAVICLPVAKYNKEQTKYVPELSFGLVDQGSTKNLVSNRAAKALNLHVLNEDIDVCMTGASGQGCSTETQYRLDLLTPDMKQVFVGASVISYKDLPAHYYLKRPIVPKGVDITTINAYKEYPRHLNSFDFLLSSSTIRKLQAKFIWNTDDMNHDYDIFSSKIFGDIYCNAAKEDVKDYYPHKNKRNVSSFHVEAQRNLTMHNHDTLKCLSNLIQVQNEPLGNYVKTPKIFDYLDSLDLSLYDGNRPLKQSTLEKYFNSLNLDNEAVLEETYSLFGPRHLNEAIHKNVENVTSYNSQKVLTKLGIIAELWAKQHEIEKFDKHDQATAENVRASDMINETLKLDTKTNRFHTKLLIRPEQRDKLNNNYQNALQRFHSMEKKIKDIDGAKTILKKEFEKFFEMGVLVEVDDADPHLGNYKHYLPYKMVCKPESTSSPYRVVFDAGAATKQCVLSLNDAIFDTPSVLENLAAIELNARFSKLLILSDIRKLYLQIQIDASSSNLMRVLYRDPFNPRDPIRTLKFVSLIWGIKDSGYQACVAIRMLFKKRINELQKEFPHLSEQARSKIASDLEYIVACIYVDDVLITHNDPQEIMRLFKLAKTTLEMGSLKLCKISSNSAELLKQFPEEAKEKVVKFVVKNKNPPFLEYPIDISDNCSILGYQYCPADDSYYFEKYTSLHNQFKVENMTKIDLASLLPRFYDNLNLLGPWKMLLKNAMRACTYEKLDWKDPLSKLSETQLLDVKYFLEDIPKLKDLRFPRWVKGNENSKILLFVDASLRGVCAAIYIVTYNEKTKRYDSYILMNNCKIPALKSNGTQQDSIPKLELAAALLGTEILNEVYTTMCTTYRWRIPKSNFFCLTDSKCSLFWIQASDPSKLTTYVKTRIDKIVQPKYNWYHCPSDLNLADPGSRSCRIDFLFSHDYQFGQPWIRKDAKTYPIRSKIEFTDVNILQGIQKKYVSTYIAQMDIHPTLKKGMIYFLNGPSRNPTYFSYNLHLMKHPMEIYSTFFKYRRVLSRVFQAISKFKTLIYSAKTVNLRNRKVKVKQHKKLAKNAVPTYIPIEYQQKAENFIIKYEQEAAYPEEIYRASKNLPMPKNSSISKFSPYLDPLNILRARGRISHFPLPREVKVEQALNFKNQIILPDSQVIRALVYQHHLDNNHLVEKAEKVLLYRKYVISNVNTILKEARKRCYECRVMHSRPSNQLSGTKYHPDFDCKTAPIAPFSRVGIDSSGAIIVHQMEKSDFSHKIVKQQKYNRMTRSKTVHYELQKAKTGMEPGTFKCYALLFLCLDTWACDIQIVSDASTSGFLKAFDRFVSQYGKPEAIFSDSAGIFYKSNKILQEVIAVINELDKAANLRQINWYYTRPYTSYQASAWERQFAIFKQSLYKMTHNKKLTYEVLNHYSQLSKDAMNRIPRFVTSYIGKDNISLLSPHDILHPRINPTFLPEYNKCDPDSLNDNILVEYHNFIRPYYDAMVAEIWELNLLHMQIRSTWTDYKQPFKPGDFCLVINKTKKKIPPFKLQKARILKQIETRDGIRTYKTITESSNIKNRKYKNKFQTFLHSELIPIFDREYLSTGRVNTLLHAFDRFKTTRKHDPEM